MAYGRWDGVREGGEACLVAGRKVLGTVPGKPLVTITAAAAITTSSSSAL